MLKNDFVKYLKFCIPDGGYVVDESNRDPMRQVFKTLEEGKRGVFLHGPTGTGKTIVFEAVKNIIHPKDPRKFKMESTINIMHDYNSCGDEVYEDFKKPENYCIDEIGIEENGKYYGKEANVIEQLIMVRYNLFKSKGIITHFTSNLSKASLQGKYGDRVISRLMEMCDFVLLLGNDRREYRNSFKLVPVVHPREFTQDEIDWKDRYEAIKKAHQELTWEQVEENNRKQKFERLMMGVNPGFQTFREEFYKLQPS